MARIAFFTERLPPAGDTLANFAYSLMRNLADQSHDIRIFSTYTPGAPLPTSHPKIEIIRPFRRWSWLEMPAAVPLLFDFQPEILHFIQPRHEAMRGFTNAMTAAAGLAPALGSASVVTSFYDFTTDDLPGLHTLSAASDLVTVSNQAQMTAMRDHFFARAHRGRSNRFGFIRRSVEPQFLVLPLPNTETRSDREEADTRTSEAERISSSYKTSDLLHNLNEITNAGQPMIYIPGQMDSHRDIRAVFQMVEDFLQNHPRAVVVFGGSWGSIDVTSRHHFRRSLSEKYPARFLMTGPLESTVERQILRLSHVVCVAPLKVESLDLTRVLRLALEESAVILMTEKQAEYDGLSWKSGENALICGDHPFDIIAAIDDSLQLDRGALSKADRIRTRLAEMTRLEVIDQPANVLSRAYAQVLARRMRNP